MSPLTLHLIIFPLMKAQVSSPPSHLVAHRPFPSSSGPSELSPQILASIYFCPRLLPSPSTFCLTSSSPRPRLIQLLLRRPLLLGCLFPPSARRRSLIFPFLCRLPSPVRALITPHLLSASMPHLLQVSRSSSAPTVPRICPRVVSVHEGGEHLHHMFRSRKLDDSGRKKKYRT